jgi:hypothetical protein
VAELSPIVVDVWKKYEDVAMHFNELIMRWRLQAIGGLAALVTAAGFVVGDASTLLVRYRAMLILSLMLTFAWAAVGLIDLLYYRLLLRGAVDAIIELEKTHPQLTLSTQIEQRAAPGSLWGPILFYVTGLVPLMGIAWWASSQLRRLPSDPTIAPSTMLPFC